MGHKIHHDTCRRKKMKPAMFEGERGRPRPFTASQKTYTREFSSSSPCSTYTEPATVRAARLASTSSPSNLHDDKVKGEAA